MISFSNLLAKLKKQLSDAGLTKPTSTGSLNLANHVGGESGVRFSSTGGFLRDTGTTHAFRREGETPIDLWFCDNNGIFLSAGNIGSDSDGRLKTNWQDIDGDALIAALTQVLHGIYDRTDIRLTQSGVDAASLEQVPGLGPCVTERDGEIEGVTTKIKSVAYGQAALVSAIKLAIRAEQQAQVIQRQGATIAELAERVAALENK